MMQATNITQIGTNELRDIRPPVAIPSGWEWLWWVAGALIIALLCYLLWRWLRKRQALAQVVPVVPPHVRALRSLEDALGQIGDARTFCIMVSDTIRFYLEERFAFRAPERTTEEFLYELQATNLLTDAQKLSLGDFLERCDLVKFARYEPVETELRDLHASAVRLVEETKPVEISGEKAVNGSPRNSSEPQGSSAARP